MNHILGNNIKNFRSKNIINYCLILLIILIICTFLGCGTNNVSTTSSVCSDNKPVIHAIIVNTAEVNEKKAWKVRWPDLAITGSFDNYYNKLDNAVNELSDAETGYFINYIESIDMMESLNNKHVSYISQDDYKGHRYLGSVEIIYDDEQTSYKRIKRYIFDEYPAGYSEFIDKFGKICGEDYIPLDYNIQEVTVKFYRRMAGISITVPDDIIEEFLNITECDMFMLLESYNYYEAQSAIEFINTYRHLPIKIINKECEENELIAYVNNLAAKFNVHESNVYKYGDNGYFFATKYGNFEVYPSNKYPYPEYINEFKSECSNVKFYNIQDNSGPEGMVYANYFVYSDDGKFMVIIPDETAKNLNEIIKVIFDE